MGGAPSGRPEWGLAAGLGGANWRPLGGGMLVPHARDSLFFNQHPPPNSMYPPKGPRIRNHVLAETRATLGTRGRVPKCIAPWSPQVLSIPEGRTGGLARKSPSYLCDLGLVPGPSNLNFPHPYGEGRPARFHSSSL